MRKTRDLTGMVGDRDDREQGQMGMGMSADGDGWGWGQIYWDGWGWVKYPSPCSSLTKMKKDV